MMLAADKDTNGGTYPMFKSFSRRTAKTVVIAIAGIAMVICASGASEAATVSKAAPSGIVEKWVYITTYSGAAPGYESFLCDQEGQAYINEGLASQYQCDLSSSGDKLYILTLAG
jgi:hypothetical protein